jgi:hypothetical protein
MADHPARTTNDAGLPPDASFLTLALETLLRLTEIYAAERNIQTLPAMSTTPRVSSIANADPVCSADTPTAASSISAALAEPPERSGASVSDHQSHEEDATAATNRRGGWTRSNSTSKQIRDGAVEYLRQKGERASGREIWEALKAKGMVTHYKKPPALVSSRIGRSPLFDRTHAGYGLVEWSRDGAERPSGKL